jgi:hypothetical protein
MARLERPFFAAWSSGPFARLLSFRRGAVTQSVARMPAIQPPPTPAQIQQRQKYREALDAWNALSEAARASYEAAAPEGMQGITFFLQQNLLSL